MSHKCLHTKHNFEFDEKTLDEFIVFTEILAQLSSPGPKPIVPKPPRPKPNQVHPSSRPKLVQRGLGMTIGVPSVLRGDIILW